jgi:RNA polymerase sigma-70 factor (ECF subfamily)
MELPAGKCSVEELVELYYQPLYGYAFRLTGAAADAEDLTQESFCKVQLCQDQLRDPAKAKAWLFRILRNLYLHRLRSERCRGSLVDVDPNVLPDETVRPLEHVDVESLQRVLAELPEVFRTPLILYYFEDFSYRDIAEQMELPIGTVMSRLARAKAQLRIRLDQNGAETT